MKQLTTGIDVRAEPRRIWDLLTHYQHWPAWGISVRAVASSGEQVEVGATGRVKTILGFWLPFTITEVADQTHWHWRVAGVPATGHFLRPAGPGITRVEFTVAWPAAPYLIVMHGSLRRLKTLAERREVDG